MPRVSTVLVMLFFAAVIFPASMLFNDVVSKFYGVSIWYGRVVLFLFCIGVIDVLFSVDRVIRNNQVHAEALAED